MKHLGLLLLALVVLAAALAGLVLARGRQQPASDCASRVIISRGPHGEPVECVCLGGRLSTCFDPGP